MATGSGFPCSGYQCRSWQIHFLEGGPNLPKDFSTDKLASWTALGDEEAQRFAGTAKYEIEFDGPTNKSDDWQLDQVGLAGRGPNSTDPGYMTIYRRASYMAFGCKTDA